jgi:iron(II)-dependent oxidoreductase
MVSGHGLKKSDTHTGKSIILAVSSLSMKNFCLTAIIIGCQLLPLLCLPVKAQTLEVETDGRTVAGIRIQGKSLRINRPLINFQVGEKAFSSSDTSPLGIQVTKPTPSNPAYLLTFLNAGKDTLHLHNIVPLGHTAGDVFITGLGKYRLSRTHLFVPGKVPVNVIVPDNAWDLGYNSFKLNDTLSVYALARRKPESVKRATLKRFETILAPGGSIAYEMHIEEFVGDWQAGLQKCFQQRHLFDLQSFDETLYNREDLKWIQKAFVMHLVMAWDKDYFDPLTKTFQLDRFLAKAKKLYGGDDVICIWPTWPTLGLDARNQFDLYRDQPGGLAALRQLADSLRAHGAKFFIAYNPWDESTRNESHLPGLSDLIKATTADGVVLDTKGESSRELQRAADRVRPGVVMYSEGMAVPRDMPGIVAGRVHNALYYPPMLNLNKLIRPDFSIFRVAEVYKEPIHREYAVSFFNGYGTEINQFQPGHPEWEEEQYKYLGRTTRILRESQQAFFSGDMKVLIPTLRDSIWVNEWNSSNKQVYTIYSLKPGGYRGPLFKPGAKDLHWVDVWSHEELTLENGYLPAKLEPFDATDLGTNNEAQVSCIAGLRDLLQASFDGTTIHFSSKRGTTIKIWKGNPSYDKIPVELPWNTKAVTLDDAIGRFEGKVVLQLFDDTELIDERIFVIKPGTARLVSQEKLTASASAVPEGMVQIPAGKFLFKTTHGDDFIPYPTQFMNESFEMPSLWMDRFPVTNAAFKAFLQSAGYKPEDTTNFLKHWKGGKIPAGQERYPVVYVSYEDAQEYARWAGKRLPSELEWQYSAQTSALNEWPWKQAKPVIRKEEKITETLTVFSLEGIDKKYCNLGDGKPYPVGKYKAGANPNGLQDLVGCVWQMTNDVYVSGSYRYIMMKGGSYFKPSSSWWYVQGGPRELHYRQYLLRVSQGFERNATVGFRCVKDASDK